MNASMIPVVSMRTVPTPLVHSCVAAKLDMKEMERIAQVDLFSNFNYKANGIYES